MVGVERLWDDGRKGVQDLPLSLQQHVQLHVSCVHLHNVVLFPTNLPNLFVSVLLHTP